jgi:hypothetical protein
MVFEFRRPITWRSKQDAKQLSIPVAALSATRSVVRNSMKNYPFFFRNRDGLNMPFGGKAVTCHVSKALA